MARSILRNPRSVPNVLKEVDRSSIAQVCSLQAGHSAAPLRRVLLHLAMPRWPANRELTRPGAEDFRWITTRSRYCGSSSIASRRAGSCTNGQRRGHGQLSPDPLQSDPKRSSQPLEYFGSPSPKDVRVEPPGSPRGRGTADRAALHLSALDVASRVMLRQ